MNRFSQTGQGKFFSPVCVLKWRASSSERANRLPQLCQLHGNGRSPVEKKKISQYEGYFCPWKLADVSIDCVSRNQLYSRLVSIHSKYATKFVIDVIGQVLLRCISECRWLNFPVHWPESNDLKRICDAGVGVALSEQCQGRHVGPTPNLQHPLSPAGPFALTLFPDPWTCSPDVFDQRFQVNVGWNFEISIIKSEPRLARPVRNNSPSRLRAE